MGEQITLKSRHDGFELSAYHVRPDDARRGGLVLIQEIFGVTGHIRELCDGYAEDGYEVIAPAFFDRAEEGFAAGYDPDGIKKGVEYSNAAPWDQVAGDIQAAVDALDGPVFVTGYCWGGAAAWLAAVRCEGVSAVSSFYGRRIPELLDETPKCPVILHFGRNDHSIPMEVVEHIIEAQPDVPVYIYDAGHGFVSNRRADYNEDCARLSRLRTLQLFTRSSGVRSEA
ncbi:MAG TPA: dienelactone hydrolase family protein [Caulobacteraceae bacterium]